MKFAVAINSFKKEHMDKIALKLGQPVFVTEFMTKKKIITETEFNQFPNSTTKLSIVSFISNVDK